MTSAADEIVGLYQRHARAWAADRNTGLFERAWLDRFLALLPDGGFILDVGCGSADPIGRHPHPKGAGRYRRGHFTGSH